MIYLGSASDSDKEANAIKGVENSAGGYTYTFEVTASKEAQTIAVVPHSKKSQNWYAKGILTITVPAVQDMERLLQHQNQLFLRRLPKHRLRLRHQPEHLLQTETQCQAQLRKQPPPQSQQQPLLQAAVQAEFIMLQLTPVHLCSV